MKKVIEGKVYNTDTAEEIASASHGYAGDFDRYDEELFRTKKGAYFLHGTGGPRSRWAESHEQNSWSAGEGLVPLSTEGALAWCESRGVDADTIEDNFDVEEA